MAYVKTRKQRAEKSRRGKIVKIRDAGRVPAAEFFNQPKMKKQAKVASRDELARDCELAAAVNKVVWKEKRRGVFGLAKKLSDAGFITTFAIGGKAHDYSWLAEKLAGPEWSAAVEYIYRLPLRIKRSDPTYKERVKNRKLAGKSRLIFFGMLTETDNDNVPKILKDEFEIYRTSYAILRVAGTNTCLVHIFGCVSR